MVYTVHFVYPISKGLKERAENRQKNQNKRLSSLQPAASIFLPTLKETDTLLEKDRQEMSVI